MGSTMPIHSSLLLCPHCRSEAEPLRPQKSIRLHPDDFWDDIDLSLYVCRCGFQGSVLHADSSGHGSLDGDDTHTLEGHVLTKEAWTKLRDAIERCPDPRNENCRCEDHGETQRNVVPGTWTRFRDGGVTGEFDVVWRPLPS